MGTIHIYSTQVTMSQMRIIMITQRLIQVLRTILLCKMFHMKETHDQRLMLLQPTMTVPKGETTTTLLMVTQNHSAKCLRRWKRTFIVMNNPINSSYLPVLQEISSESFYSSERIKLTPLTLLTLTILLL